MADALSPETFDVSARKFHQALCVALLALAYVLGPPAAVVLVGLVGAVLLIGRFWWPADLFRQLAWRVLEPAGILSRREVAEDHSTRRVARVIGGAALLASALALAAGQPAAWVVVALLAVMIGLDAAFDFCALCWASYQLGRVRAR
jgi:hypothetical protein